MILLCVRVVVLLLCFHPYSHAAGGDQCTYIDSGIVPPSLAAHFQPHHASIQSTTSGIIKHVTHGCKIKTNLDVYEKTAIPNSQGWARCQHCTLKGRTLFAFDETEAARARNKSESSVHSSWSLWGEFFRADRNDLYHARFTDSDSLFRPSVPVDQQQPEPVKRFIIDRPVFVLPIITFHVGHVLIDLLEQLYHTHIRYYGHIRNDCLIFIDVANPAERAVLQDKLFNRVEAEYKESTQTHEDDSHTNSSTDGATSRSASYDERNVHTSTSAGSRDEETHMGTGSGSGTTTISDTHTRNHTHSTDGAGSTAAGTDGRATDGSTDTQQQQQQQPFRLREVESLLKKFTKYPIYSIEALSGLSTVIIQKHHQHQHQPPRPQAANDADISSSSSRSSSSSSSNRDTTIPYSMFSSPVIYQDLHIGLDISQSFLNEGQASQPCLIHTGIGATAATKTLMNRYRQFASFINTEEEQDLEEEVEVENKKEEEEEREMRPIDSFISGYTSNQVNNSSYNFIRVLFVQRSSNRRILNLEELVGIMTAKMHSTNASSVTLNHKVIYLESMWLHEQKQALQWADIVVTMAGTAAHNVLFMRPERSSIVLLMQSAQWCAWAYTYANQAKLLGIEPFIYCGRGSENKTHADEDHDGDEVAANRSREEDGNGVMLDDGYQYRQWSHHFWQQGPRYSKNLDVSINTKQFTSLFDRAVGYVLTAAAAATATAAQQASGSPHSESTKNMNNANGTHTSSTVNLIVEEDMSLMPLLCPGSIEASSKRHISTKAPSYSSRSNNNKRNSTTRLTKQQQRGVVEAYIGSVSVDALYKQQQQQPPPPPQYQSMQQQQAESSHVPESEASKPDEWRLSIVGEIGSEQHKMDHLFDTVPYLSMCMRSIFPEDEAVHHRDETEASNVKNTYSNNYNTNREHGYIAEGSNEHWCYPIAGYNYYAYLNISVELPLQYLHFWVQTNTNSHSIAGKIRHSDVYVVLDCSLPEAGIALQRSIVGQRVVFDVEIREEDCCCYATSAAAGADANDDRKKHNDHIHPEQQQQRQLTCCHNPGQWRQIISFPTRKYDAFRAATSAAAAAADTSVDGQAKMCGSSKSVLFDYSMHTRLSLQRHTNHFCRIHALTSVNCMLFIRTLQHYLQRQELSRTEGLPVSQRLPDAKHPFFFMHIEKTAGTTLREFIYTSVQYHGLDAHIPCFTTNCSVFALPKHAASVNNSVKVEHARVFRSAERFEAIEDEDWSQLLDFRLVQPKPQDNSNISVVAAHVEFYALGQLPQCSGSNNSNSFSSSTGSHAIYPWSLHPIFEHSEAAHQIISIAADTDTDTGTSSSSSSTEINAQKLVKKNRLQQLRLHVEGSYSYQSKLSPQCAFSCFTVARHPVDRAISYYYQRFYTSSIGRNTTTSSSNSSISGASAQHEQPQEQQQQRHPEQEKARHGRRINDLTREELEWILLTAREGKESYFYPDVKVIIDEGMVDAACRSVLGAKYTTGRPVLADQPMLIPPDIDTRLYPLVRQNVQQCVIGMQSQWNETLQVLDHWFPWIDFSQQPHLQRMKIFADKESHQTIKPELYSLIVELNPCDMMLYEEMQRLFQLQLQVLQLGTRSSSEN